jgi:hypothetical protein
MPVYLVGVDYFSGWWAEKPNGWFTDGHDWRPDFPQRVPLLGDYNDQATLNREIRAASSHGVDFFQFLWYYQGHTSQLSPHSEKLNAGLEHFVSSPYSNQMKFTLEYVNNEPRFWVNTDDAWHAACKTWCSYMKRKNYLRIDGRPLFKIHGLGWFLKENGNDLKLAANRIQYLRDEAKKMGLPNPLIGGGVMAGDAASLSSDEVAPYDFLATYTDIPPLPQKKELYPYSDLIQFAEQAWRSYGKSSLKDYIPYVPAGWDPRPWKYPASPSFKMPTLPEWENALEKVKLALDTYSQLGVPTSDGGRQKILLIYCWNEFGEGGIAAPTHGRDELMLQGIQKVFGSPTAHK